MLLCDGCDRGCHLLCAQLKSMPRAPTWHCTDCNRRAQQQEQQPGRQRLTKRAAAGAAASPSDDSGLSSDSEDFKAVPARKVLVLPLEGHAVAPCNASTLPHEVHVSCLCLPICQTACPSVPLLACLPARRQQLAAPTRCNSLQLRGSWRRPRASCGKVSRLSGCSSSRRESVLLITVCQGWVSTRLSWVSTSRRR